MTSQTQKGDSPAPFICTAKDVENYLQSHPEFFQEFPQLLTNLEVPHPSGGAVSLIERQVALLRQENKQLRAQIKELVEIARENEHLIKKMHVLSIQLIETKNLDQFLDTINAKLVHDFSANLVSVKLFNEFFTDANGRVEVVAKEDAILEIFSKLIEHKNPVCGRFNHLQLEYLFADKADMIKSMALIPLIDGEVVGMIAIASEDPERFKAGISTSFLISLGEIVSAVVKRFEQR